MPLRHRVSELSIVQCHHLCGYLHSHLCGHLHSSTHTFPRVSVCSPFEPCQEVLGVSWIYGFSLFAPHKRLLVLFDCPFIKYWMTFWLIVWISGVCWPFVCPSVWMFYTFSVLKTHLIQALVFEQSFEIFKPLPPTPVADSASASVSFVCLFVIVNFC